MFRRTSLVVTGPTPYIGVYGGAQTFPPRGHLSCFPYPLSPEYTSSLQRRALFLIGFQAPGAHFSFRQLTHAVNCPSPIVLAQHSFPCFCFPSSLGVAPPCPLFSPSQCRTSRNIMIGSLPPTTKEAQNVSLDFPSKFQSPPLYTRPFLASVTAVERVFTFLTSFTGVMHVTGFRRVIVHCFFYPDFVSSVLVSTSQTHFELRVLERILSLP